LTVIFPGELRLATSGPPLTVPEENFWVLAEWVFVGMMSFLPPTHQRQSIEWNIQH